MAAPCPPRRERPRASGRCESLRALGGRQAFVSAMPGALPNTLPAALRDATAVCCRLLQDGEAKSRAEKIRVALPFRIGQVDPRYSLRTPYPSCPTPTTQPNLPPPPCHPVLQRGRITAWSLPRRVCPQFQRRRRHQCHAQQGLARAAPLPNARTAAVYTCVIGVPVCGSARGCVGEWRVYGLGGYNCVARE